MVAGDTRVARGGVWQRRGRADLSVDSFISGVTRPTLQNTGLTPGVALTPYTGINAGGLLTISASTTTTYQNVDFGTTRIKHSGSGALNLINCKFLNTRISSSHSNTQPMVDARASGHGPTYMYRCTVDNASQADGGNTGVMGWNITIERCSVQNFTDNLGFYIPGSPGAASAPINVIVRDCWLGPMAWFWNSTSGIVHPNDTKTHNDGIQFQGGYGWQLINTTILGIYSTTIGTGTPGSGSDNGWTGQPTYSAGVTARFQIVEGSGTYSAGQPGEFLGGSIAGIMVTPPTNGSKGFQNLGLIDHCWGSGGAYWLNSGAATVGDWGTVRDTLVQDNQRNSGYAIAIATGVPATVTNNFWANASWVSTGVAIPRRNA